MKSAGHLLIDDHEQINRLLRSSVSMLRSGMFELARTLFEDFREEVRHHIEVEERHLFEPYLARTGDPEGAVEEMRRQHVELEARMGALLEDLDWSEKEALRIEEEMEGLEEFLGQHCRLEEKTLYPFVNTLAEQRRNQLEF